MIEIDGSQGEGGGQILRSALTLSILTGQAMTIANIRKRRSKPGLMAQHLKSVQAAAAICAASVEGAEPGSQELAFQPGEIYSGHYRFDIGTAGSTSLVLQTIFLPLCLAGGSSTVILTGGTHVPHSPSFDYLDLHWLPYMRQLGCRAELNIEQAGVYPHGGGHIRAAIRPAGPLGALEITSRGALQNIQGLSAVANLDPEIAKRQKHQALRRLEPLTRATKIKDFSMPAAGKGTTLLLQAGFERSSACYFSLGERGKPAERVADEAVDGLQVFLATDGAIDQYLADQLLLPLAVAAWRFGAGPSRLRTCQVTQHLLTNAWIVRLFLPVRIEIEGELGEPGFVTVSM